MTGIQGVSSRPRTSKNTAGSATSRGLRRPTSSVAHRAVRPLCVCGTDEVVAPLRAIREPFDGLVEVVPNGRSNRAFGHVWNRDDQPLSRWLWL